MLTIDYYLFELLLELGMRGLNRLIISKIFYTLTLLYTAYTYSLTHPLLLPIPLTFTQHSHHVGEAGSIKIQLPGYE